MASVVPDNLTKEQYMYLAKLSEQAECYEEMVQFMEKFVVGSTLAAELIKEEGRKNEEHVPLIKEYRFMVESKLSDVYASILKLLDSNLVSLASASESKVFYLTMKDDYHRYMAEFKSAEKRKIAAEDTMLAYKAAQDIALAVLSPTHPIRLGLALNFSVFYYEILNQSDKACSMDKQENMQETE
ncbi:hypothetical protein ACFX10_009415 [Malus domestica]